MTTEQTAAAGRRGGLKRLYREMWRHGQGRRRQMAAALAMLTAAQLLRLTIPYFFGESVNALQTGGAQDVRAAAFYTALTLAAAILAWLIHGPARVMERYTALTLRERMQDALYAKAVSLTLGWHESHHSGDSIQRMTKAATALCGFAEHQFLYLQNMINLVGPLAALFVISRLTGGVAIAGYALIILVLVRFDARMLDLHRQVNAAERRHAAELTDCLGNISTVLTLRLQEATRRGVAARAAEIARPQRANVVVNEVKWFFVDLLNTILRTGLVVLYAWLSWRDSGRILVGTAVMVYQYSQQVGAMISALGMFWQDLVRYQADVASADPILAAESRPGIQPRPELAGWREIGVENLTFSHHHRRSDAPILNNLRFQFRRGDRIALVGESGSGKSTLLRLLSGLYDAESARYSIDGRPLPDLHHLGAIATLVPQDPEIFEGSLLQNVTMGIDYPPEAVREALDLACVAPLVARLPAGLDTVITERGLNFSGGQKQRLALARGILASRDCSLILLDESTSSVDPATEAKLYDALFTRFPDACIIATLHRPHLLPRFGRVLRMAGGHIVGEETVAA